MPLRFPGQYADAETGLYENWNRFYDPAIGRYLTSDPLNSGQHGVPLSKNNYGYADNNPLLNVDPNGLVVVNYDEVRKRLEASSRAVTILDNMHRRTDMKFEIVNGVPTDPKNKDGWAGLDTSKAQSSTDKLIRVVINEDKINAAGPSQAAYAEVVAHEGTHALHWRPSWEEQDSREGQKDDGPAYLESAYTRQELGLPVDKTWLNAHPAGWKAVAGLKAPEALGDTQWRFMVNIILKNGALAPSKPPSTKVK